jgi:hypothetical protein
MPETLREQQFTLARHLRDLAANPPPPGIEARRLKVYRELFYGAIEGLLAGSFPVLRQTSASNAGMPGYTTSTPTTAARRRCSPKSPRRSSITCKASTSIRPGSWSCAHYEWVEAQLYLSDAQDPLHHPDGDLLAGEPLLSCVARVLAYRWPVERIGPDFQPTKRPRHRPCCWCTAISTLRSASPAWPTSARQLLVGLPGTEGNACVRWPRMKRMAWRCWSSCAGRASSSGPGAEQIPRGTCLAAGAALCRERCAAAPAIE